MYLKNLINILIDVLEKSGDINVLFTASDSKELYDVIRLDEIPLHNKENEIEVSLKIEGCKYNETNLRLSQVTSIETSKTEVFNNFISKIMNVSKNDGISEAVKLLRSRQKLLAEFVLLNDTYKDKSLNETEKFNKISEILDTCSINDDEKVNILQGLDINEFEINLRQVYDKYLSNKENDNEDSEYE